MNKIRLNTLLVLIFSVSTISSIFAQDTRKFGVGVNADPNARLEINGKLLNYDLFRITFDAPGAVPSDTIILVDSLGNFGIGTIPTERFDVIGGIRIGNTTNTNAGAMRWTGTNFEGYDGSSWINLGVGVSADNVIGNEVLNATTSEGLIRAGAGTAIDPYTLGIATGGVTSTHILDGTVARVDITDNAINSAKIANGTITNTDVSGTAEIAVTKLGQGTSTGQLIRTNGTNVEWWTPNFSTTTHAATHLRGGADELNGDQVDVDWNPSYYTPATTPTQVSNVDHLTAHLYGIDQSLNGKEPTITGAATTITSSNLTASRALVSNASGKVAASGTITTTELNRLNGVTSNVQTQLNAKQATITGAATTITSANLTANRAVISNGSGKVAASSTITTTELGYLNGVTSNVQTQLNGKASTSHAATHIRAGTDELNGDQLDIDWNPTNYTPATTPTQVSSVDHLTAHLYGIDQAIGSGGITGSGTTNYVSKWTGTNTQGNSQFYDNGTNIGIGTTNPIGKLQVHNGFVMISRVGGDATLYLSDSKVGAAGMFGYMKWDESDDRIQFGTDANIHMSILDNGNIGIGTQSPVADLHVNGGVRVTDLGGSSWPVSTKMVVTDSDGDLSSTDIPEAASGVFIPIGYHDATKTFNTFSAANCVLGNIDLVGGQTYVFRTTLDIRFTSSGGGNVSTRFAINCFDAGGGYWNAQTVAFADVNWHMISQERTITWPAGFSCRGRFQYTCLNAQPNFTTGEVKRIMWSVK